MHHVRPDKDIFAPDYVPTAGQRIFINMPEELREPIARNILQVMYGRAWGQLPRKHKNELGKTAELLKSGSPYLISWK